MTHRFSHIAAVFGRTLLAALLALTLLPALSFAAGGADGDTMPLPGANEGDVMTMSLQDAPYEEGEILVVFASGTSEQEARFSLLSLEDTKEDCVDSALNEASIADVSGEKAVVVPLEEGASVSKAVKEAMKDPAVHGDEYVTVQIKVPRNPTQQEKEKIRELQGLSQAS